MKKCLIFVLLTGVFASESLKGRPSEINALFDASKNEELHLDISKPEDYTKFAAIMLKTNSPNQWADICLDYDDDSFTTVEFTFSSFESKNNDYEEQILSFILNGKELTEEHVVYLAQMNDESKLRLADEILSHSNSKYTRDLVVEIFSLDDFEDTMHLYLVKAREYGLDFVYQDLASRINVYNFAMYYCQHSISLEEIIPFAEELKKLPSAKRSQLLYVAVNTYHFNFATFLIKDLKFSLPIVGKSRKTLLHSINQHVKADFLRLLLSDPVYLAKTDINERSFLFSWIKSGLPIEIFKFAFENIDPSVLRILLNQRDRFGTSLLAFVMVNRRHDLLLLFLRNGASTDIQVPVRIPEFNASKVLKEISHFVPLAESQIPRPPLDYAIYNRDYEAAMILLNESTGHFDQTNALKQTAFDVAVQTKDQTIIAAVENAMKN